MGKRKRRVIKTMKKTLPKIFNCPQCGVSSIRISINKLKEHAIVACGNCDLRNEYHKIGKKESIDIFNKFIDNFMSETI